MHFFGLKLHGIGFYRPSALPQIDILQVSPASQHDLTAQRQALENAKEVALFADKAYCDKDLKKQFIQNKGELLTPVKYKKEQTLQDKQRHKAAGDLYSKAYQKSDNLLKLYSTGSLSILIYNELQRYNRLKVSLYMSLDKFLLL